MLEAINNAGWGVKLLAFALVYLLASIVIHAFIALPRIAKALEDIAKHVEEEDKDAASR